MPLPTQHFSEVIVGGVPFKVSSLEHATQWILDTLTDHREPGIQVRLANTYCVALAASIPEYANLLATSGVNFPDGTPVVAVMRALGASPIEARRVRGPSLFREVLRGGVQHDIRHYFLGSTPHTLQALTTSVEREYPGIQIVGSYSPPFRDADSAYLEDIVARARESGADIIWVGMGTPKQDFIAAALAEGAGITAIGIGAGFDFLAGTVKEAPEWVQRNGVEWAYRLAKEPRRLWHRYLFGNVRFMSIATKQLIRSGRGLKLLNPKGMKRNRTRA